MELYQALRIMEKRSGLEIKELFVSGGGSRSDTVCRITADVFGLPVKRIQTPEACSIGSSMAALVALGVYDSFEQAAKEMSAMAASFWVDNRRVDNTRIKRDLGVRLRYPDYRAGLAAILSGTARVESASNS